MDKNKELAIYRFNLYVDRMGSIEGTFTATPNHVRLLVDSGMQVHFGEVLGKHSEIIAEIAKADIELITDNAEVVSMFEEYGLGCGYNPFNFNASNIYREDLESLYLYEIVEILEKEEEEELNNHLKFKQW